MDPKTAFADMAGEARETARKRREREAGLRKEQALARAKRRDLERAMHARAPSAAGLVGIERKRRLETFLLAEEAALNGELAAAVGELESLLAHSLRIDDAIEFDSLKINGAYVPDPLPDALTREPKVPTLDEYHGKVKRKSLLEKALGSRRYDKQLAQARKEYSYAMVAYHRTYLERQALLAEYKARTETSREAHGRRKAKREKEVEALRAGYLAHEPDAVLAYAGMVLELSRYPEAFPQRFLLGYDADAKSLRVEYCLPPPAVVPATGSYRYVKTRAVVEPRPWRKYDAEELYKKIISSIALRTLHELFEADRADAIRTIAFHGYAWMLDKATGKDVRPWLVSVRADRAPFLGLDLTRAEPKACVLSMGNLSRKPGEGIAVPLVPASPAR